jgi:hypothetical protein
MKHTCLKETELLKSIRIKTFKNSIGARMLTFPFIISTIVFNIGTISHRGTAP